MKRTDSWAPPIQLTCPACGNSDRFIEVMAEEAHLVDGSLKYIRLIEGIVDRYTCWQCGVSIEAPEAGKP
jgi:transposase